MAFAWAFTEENLLRSTWKDSHVESASTEAAGYPKENAINGNIESEWQATASPGTIVIDSYDAALDMEYLCLWFDISKLPSSVKIETSDDDISYTALDNNYDLTVSKTTSAVLDGTSRIVSLNNSTDIHVGNTVRIEGGGYDKRYLVVAVGTGYIEISRYPDPFPSGATVKVSPGPVIIAVVGAAESKRYIKLTVTGSPAHLLEVQAFKVAYTFDGDLLPLNPFPVAETRRQGGVIRSMSGYVIGKMQTGPARSRWGVSIGKMYRDARHVLYWLNRQERIGVLMDSGEWWECIPAGDLNMSRRPSSDADLVSYAAQMILEEV